MLSKLVDKLTQREQERNKDAQVQYAEIKRSLADGKELDPEAVEVILKSTGKSPADLQADVELLQQRREWRKLIDGEPELKRAANEIAEKIDAERKRFRSLQQEHELALEELNQQRNQIADELKQVNNANTEMSKTSPVKEEQSEIYSKGAAENRISDFESDRRSLESLGRKLREQHAGVKGLQAELDGQTRPFSSPDNIKKQIAITEGQIAYTESQIQTIEQRMKSRQDRCRELQEEVLTS